MGFDKETIAGNILAERSRRRWSREKLAEVSNIPGSTIKAYDEFAGRKRKAS